MRLIRLLMIAIASFFGTIIGEGLVRRAIALLMCGVLSFSSTTCYRFLSNQANASITSKKVSSTTYVEKNENNAEFPELQIEENELITQIPRVRQQNPQPGDVPIHKPNNNSPQVVPQMLIQDSVTSPKNQSSESNSHCSDSVNGFNLYSYANGICIYKASSEINVGGSLKQQDIYVTTVDMSKAKLQSLTGPINNNNSVSARDSNYFLNNAEKISVNFKQKQRLKFRAMVNGTFFQTYRTSEIYPYNIIDQDRMIPLGIRSGEKIIQSYNPDKVVTNFAHRAMIVTT